MKGVIYSIENKINNKKYIGQTIRDFSIRKSAHINFPHVGSVIGKAIEKYGEDQHELGLFIDPISASIIYNFVKREIYNGED
jgi:hypothetical protein